MDKKNEEKILEILKTNFKVIKFKIKYTEDSLHIYYDNENHLDDMDFFLKIYNLIYKYLTEDERNMLAILYDYDKLI